MNRVHLYVHRDAPKPGHPTLGKLYIWRDGVWKYFSETLEDEYRGQDPRNKVAGRTCIPCGDFILSIDYSPKFGRPMPHIHGPELDDNWQGLRIHALNTADQTEGCLGVGARRGVISGQPAILDSRVTFAQLEAVLTPYLGGKAEGVIGTIKYSFDAPFAAP